MKKKGIFKALGIGALACLGMATFTGCSLDLSQSQMDKLMYTVENADTFMEESLDLLNKQNANLDLDEAFRLFNLAKARYLLNDDGMRDNLKLTINICLDDGTTNNGVLKFFKTEDCDVCLSEGTSVTESRKALTYVDSDDVYIYRKDSSGYSKTLVEEDVSGIEYYWNTTMCPFTLLEAGKDDIIKCELLDNGNYKITLLIEAIHETDTRTYRYYQLYELELTSDATVVSEYMQEGKCDGEGTLIEKVSGTVTYEYGVVTESDIADLLAEAKAASVNQ